jgi:hypothetical protein
VSVFPPAAAVTVLLDGQIVHAYNAAYTTSGRIYAPVKPFLTRIADRVWFERDTLVMVRDGRVIRVNVPSHHPDALDEVYVPFASVARQLGADVRYLGADRIAVSMPTATKTETPAPFDASIPQVAPTPVFTPTTTPTPRPVWNGSPLPRRTPLPLSSPKPAASGGYLRLRARVQHRLQARS